jgi:DNA uptake protein ComE-like DNA-binding protein
MNLNRATAEQLQSIGQLDGTRARYLIDHRRRNGAFLDWDDVKQVPSYEDGMVERLQQAGFTVEGNDGGGAGRGGGHDLNRASADELEKTNMIDGERAERLVAFRNTHGPFADWQQVKNVSGFDDGLVARLKEAGFRI